MKLLAFVLLFCGFAEYAGAQPHITSVSSLSAAPGATITITGSSFNTVDAANNVVFFGNVKATASSVNGGGTELTVTVPGGAQYAHISVLDSITQQTGLFNKMFVPAYSNNCYIPGSMVFKAEVDQAITSPFSATAMPRHSAMGDVDGDGRPDFVVSTYGGSGQSIVNVFLNTSVNGALAFNSTPYVCTTGSGGTNVKLADLDGDGKLDIIVACGGSGRVSLLHNISTGTGMAGLSFAVKRDIFTDIRGPQEVAIADFDNDGQLDIAAICTDDTAIRHLRIFRNTMTLPIAATTFPGNSFGTTSTAGDYVSFKISGVTNPNASSIATADFDGDGWMDIVVGRSNEGAVSVLKNTSTSGNINFGTYQDLSTGGFGPSEVNVADINGDGKAEVIIANYFSGTLAVFQNTSISPSINFSLVLIPTVQKVYGIVPGDYDGDGDVDVAMTVNPLTSAANNLTIVNNIFSGTAGGAIDTGSMHVGDSYNLGNGVGAQGVTFGDFDLDGKPDIVVADQDANKIAIFEAVGTPSISAATTQDSVCESSTFTARTALACAGETGSWSSVTGNASVVALGVTGDTATVTGVSAGVDTLVFKAVYLSDTNYIRRVVYINAVADTGIISGVPTLCQRANAQFTTTAVGGGVWSSSDTTIATVDATTGMVYGVGVGNAIIHFTAQSLRCGPASGSYAITVLLRPTAPSITPASTGTCIGSVVTLSTAGGGNWFNMDPSIGTLSIGSAANASVTGAAVGVDTIIYTFAVGGCSDTSYASIAFVAPGVSPASGPIAGNTTLCQGETSTLTNPMTGGTATWTSLNTAVATINSAGQVFGVINSSTTSDTATIRYHIAYSCGSADTFTVVTVLPLPHAGNISGPDSVFLGSTISLTASVAGGAWSSSNTAVATLSASGSPVTVNPVSVGNTLISYTVGNVCGFNADTQTVRVLPVLSVTATAGSYVVCSGTNTTITAAGATTYTWSPATGLNSSTGATVTFSGTTTTTYTVTGTGSGSATDTAIVTINVNTLPNVVASAGSTTLCAGQSTTLSALPASGVTFSWTPSASLVSTTGTPVTTNTLSGTTTFTVTGTDGNSCSNTSTVTVNVNNLPNVTANAVPTAICEGSTSTLTAGGATSYTWSPATGITTTNTATTTFNGTSTSTYTVTGTDANSCVNTATVTVTVNTVPTVSATAASAAICTGSATTLTATGGATYSWSPAAGISATTGASVNFSGTSTTTYTVTGSNGTCTDTGIVTVTVNALPVVAASAGATTLCAGQSTTLSASSATAISYSWIPSASLVSTTGTPVTTNTLSGTTIFTVTGTDGNSCSNTSTVTVNVNNLPNVTANAAPTAICEGSTSTLTAGGATSYTWSPATGITTTNTATTTFNGTSTSTYTVTGTDANSCVNTATVTVTVSPVPSVSATAANTTICQGTTTTLTAIGGTTYSWSPATGIDATTGASVVFSGTATTTYTVTGTTGSCSDTGIVVITVTPAPAIVVTVGATTLCAGQTTTLSALGYPTYSWSPGADLSASTGSLVTFSGSNTATYTVTGSNAGCTADTVITITVNPLPDAGTITGTATNICIGSTLTLTSTVIGGSWSMTNAHATIATVGQVTGVSVGVDTAVYTVSNSCGTAYDSFVVTIDPQPFADTIHGADTMCLTSGTITLTNPVAGGTWISTNTTLATISATGVVTPLATGIDTILYLYTNSCGTDTSEPHQLVIIGTPSAGVISGPAFACIGSTISLTNTVTGGVWTSNNVAVATIDTNGVLTPVDTGVVVVHYTFTNFCGTADTTDTVRVNPLPVAGFISNPVTALCVGQSVTLTDTTSGGVWSTSDPAVLTVTSVGRVTGVTAGVGAISYTVTNICGSASVMDTITVNPLPTLSSASTGVVCSGSAFIYTPASSSAGATYSWSRAAVPLITPATNSGVGGINEVLTSASPDTVYATYVYTVSALGCDNPQNVVLTVKPLPVLSTDTSITICSGAPVLYIASSATEGTIFTWTRPAVTGISPATNNGSYVISETLVSTLSVPVQVNYNFTLNAAGCVNTETVHARVEPAPPTPPHISTTSPPFVCLGTMYQNFGVSALPPTGINYAWSSGNAEVWATGSTDQYCLVNFDQNPGLAWVYVSASYAGYTCTSRDSFAVVVTGAVSDHPEVWYFNEDFSCTPSDESSYQWGYDDALTLDSTLLAGETNQSYHNPAPDWANKFYWVITTRHGCFQKTYYTTPTGIKNITEGGVREMNMYPNPNNGAFTVNVASDFTEQGILMVTNMVGEKVMEVPCSTNRKVEMHLDQPAGIYFVTVQTAHGKISGKVTIIGN